LCGNQAAGATQGGGGCASAGELMATQNAVTAVVSAVRAESFDPMTSSTDQALAPPGIDPVAMCGRSQYKSSVWLSMGNARHVAP
jgi:hypothetical protein